MKNVLFQPFFKILATMKEKYGVEEIPSYVCRGIDKYSPVISIGKTLTYTTDTTIEKFNEYYHKLIEELNNGFVVNFDWNGVPRMVIFTRQRGFHLPYHAYFRDSNDYTNLGFEYDPERNLFLAYCNVIVSVDADIEYTQRCMSNVRVRRICI